MEDQGKNGWQASHTAASGTALYSSSLEFQVLRREMTIKLYPVQIFFSASVERLVRKECYDEEQRFQIQNSSTYKMMLERS